MHPVSVFSKSECRNFLQASLFLTVIFGSGCSGGNILNTLSGASKYLAYPDVEYGSHSRHKMDIYLPNGADSNDEQYSCKVMFIHGGSWQSGDKDTYKFVGAALAERGYFVAIPNYRLYPDAVFPDFVRDIATALDHPLLRKNQPKEKIALIGHSAGAFNAAHVSYDKSYLHEVGLDTASIDLFISLAGPHDYFLPSEKPKWRAIFGQTDTQQQTALSVNYIGDDSPTTLILHGSEDNVVTPRSAYSLAGKLATHNIPHELKVYEDVGHIKIIGALASPLKSLAPTLNDIQEFLHANGCRRHANGT